MPKQLDQQRNGRRADLPDDFKSLLMQAVIVTREESSQQRERTSRPFDQGGFGGCADLPVVRPAGDLPSHAPGRDFWKDSTPSEAAVIGTARPLG